MTFTLLLAFTVFAPPDIEVLRPDPVREELRWTGWVTPGQAIEVNNLWGDIRAVHTDGDELEVVAVKKGSAEPEEVAIEIVEHKGGLTVCAMYPNRDAAKPFECRPSDGGGYRVASTLDGHARVRYEQGGGGDVETRDLRVDFIVRIPRGVRLIARTLDGDVDARALDRDLEAHTVFGNVLAPKPVASKRTIRVKSTEGNVFLLGPRT